MKKIFRLSTNEAIKHFILKDNTVITETPDEIGQKVADLHRLSDGMSVSIIIPTHRIAPDYSKDVILLKNKIDEAVKRLYETMDKRMVWPIEEALKEARESVEHDLNLDTLVVYANERFSSVVKLPIKSEEEVSIGKYFDFRPLYKAMQQTDYYYIICVSQHTIRLIEAINDKAIKELTASDFPFDKDAYYTMKWDKPREAGFKESMEKEFYNDADKSFREVYAQNPLPVVLAGDVKSVTYYREQMDDSQMVIGSIHGSFDETPLHAIVLESYEVVKGHRRRMMEAHLAEIDAAESAGRLVTGIQEAIKYAEEGRVDALFVGNNFTLTDDSGDLTKEEKTQLRIKSDEVYFKLIKDVSHNGGRVIFLDDSLLEKYDGMVMTARF